MLYTKFYYLTLFIAFIFTSNLFNNEVPELPHDILNLILNYILEDPDISENSRIDSLNTFNILSKKHNKTVKNYVQKFKSKNNIVDSNYNFAKFKHDFLVKNVNQSTQYIFDELIEQLSEPNFTANLDHQKFILQVIKNIILSDPDWFIKEYGKEYYASEISPLIFEIYDLQNAGHPYIRKFKKLETERIMNEI